MTPLAPALSAIEPDPGLLNKLVWVKRVSLAFVALIAGSILAAWLLPSLGEILPSGWQLMKADTSLAAFFSAFSLLLSEPWRSRRMHLLSLLLAALVALMGASVLAEYWLHVFYGIGAMPPPVHEHAFVLLGRMAPQTAGGFVLLGVAMTLIRAQKGVIAQIADLLVFCQCLLILVLVSGRFFGALWIFSITATILNSPQTLFCLLLLTMVAVLRRAENGVFAIFLGRGIGGRIARTISPILLVLPLLREFGRAYLLRSQRVPEQYATAILTSITTMVSFALLLILAWRINSMEMEIHELSLRDPLTGVYNLKGFHLLAEQSLRLAHRNQQPFSALFIDLDNLKQINDSFGHGAGSAFLAETGEILKAAFRETDVLGRIGGDEFAVAGEFSQRAISIAAERLQAACALRNREADQLFSLSFSIGYATSVEHENTSLKDLLAKADEAMYQEKRRKKMLRD